MSLPERRTKFRLAVTTEQVAPQIDERWAVGPVASARAATAARERAYTLQDGHMSQATLVIRMHIHAVNDAIEHVARERVADQHDGLASRKEQRGFEI